MHFDVYRTTGAMKVGYPFLLSVQSNRLSGVDTVVVPMEAAVDLPGRPDAALNPEFTIERMSVRLVPMQIFTIPSNRLGRPVHGLKDYDTVIVRGLDALFSTA